jgi:hypothetical protein
VNDIPNNQSKIDKIEAQIAFLEKYIKKPSLLKPPEELMEQLVYPTSTTGLIFRRLEKDTSNNRFDLIIREFKQLTDDPLEIDILIDIAFEFAWRNTEWPFCDRIPLTFPTFKDVKLMAVDSDARLLRNRVYTENATIDSLRTNLVFDYIYVAEGAKLTITEGAKLYMHAGANIIVDGEL